VGGSVVLDSQALQSGYRTPYWIDEIRMQVYMTNAGALGSIQGVSKAVSFQFRTGSYAFSLTPIPMGLYAPIYYGFERTANPDEDLYAQYSDNTVRRGCDARWVLPKPLWMEPGDVIQCFVQRDPTIASDGSLAFSGDVAYVGRACAPGARAPIARYVPWAAYFSYPFADASYRQTTTEFRNPFNKPLMIHRLIGKTGDGGADGGNYLLPRLTGGVNLQYMLPASGNDAYTAIRISDSLGYAIVPTFTPVGNVFDTERNTWTFSRPIGPREQLDMQFRREGTDNPVAGYTFDVSMLAYREEAG
jgi:hypothetical protein